MVKMSVFLKLITKFIEIQIPVGFTVELDNLISSFYQSKERQELPRYLFLKNSKLRRLL